MILPTNVFLRWKTKSTAFCSVLTADIHYPPSDLCLCQCRHFCACPKPGHIFPMSYIVAFFMLNSLRWKVIVLLILVYLFKLYFCQVYEKRTVTWWRTVLRCRVYFRNYLYLVQNDIYFTVFTNYKLYQFEINFLFTTNIHVYWLNDNSKLYRLQWWLEYNSTEMLDSQIITLIFFLRSVL